MLGALCLLKKPRYNLVQSTSACSPTHLSYLIAPAASGEGVPGDGVPWPGERGFTSRGFFGAASEAGLQGAQPLPGGLGGVPPAYFFFNCLFRRRRNRQLKRDGREVLKKTYP